MQEMKAHKALKTGWVALTAAGLLAACTSTAPIADLELEQVRADLRMAEQDSELERYAPAELQAARVAIRELESNPTRDKEVRAHLAYMAERRIDIAKARAAERAERDALIELERDRDRILINASRREAEVARAEAERLRLESIANQEATQRAQDEAADAQRTSLEERRQAELARQEAEQAQRLADAQAREAELARREAELASAQASALRRRLENLQARETSRGLVFTLGDVLFQTGEAELKAESLANLSRLVGFIEEYPDRTVNIEGHTDSVGTAESNLALSQRRAENVRNALVDAGVNAIRLNAIGLGEEFPLADNNTDFGRQQNRRVEIVILNPNSDG